MLNTHTKQQSVESEPLTRKVVYLLATNAITFLT
jgi:hypothetical protein